MKGSSFNIGKGRKSLVTLDYVIVFITSIILVIDYIICSTITDETIIGVFALIMMISLVNFIKALVDIYRFHSKKDDLYYYM